MSVSKNVYIDKSYGAVKKCNSKSHSTIKVKPADVNSSTYFDIGKENDNKDPKFKVGDHVRTSKYKINCSEYIFFY